MRHVDYPLLIHRGTRDGSRAVIEIGRLPEPYGWPEVRFVVDGRLHYSRVCKRPTELQAEVDALRADMISHGWTFEAEAQAPH